jgi:hypothetical protein
MLDLTYYNNGTTKIPAFPQCVAPASRSYDNAAYGFSFGYASSGDGGTSALANPLPYTTAFLHGNVNFVDKTVTWDSNTADHALPPSLYRAAKPTWFGNVSWPPIGPDVAGYTSKIPAQLRYEGVLSGIFRKEAVRHFGKLSAASGCIQYRILQSGTVRLEIHTLAGRHVATLVNTRMESGEHSVLWDQTALPTGIYVCSLWAEKFQTAIRVVVRCDR